MTFLLVEDLTGEVEVVVFSDLYEKHQEDLQVDRVVLLKGQTDYKEEGEVKIICREVTIFPAEPRQLFIRIDAERPLAEMVALKDILTAYHGGNPVYLYFEEQARLLLTGQACWVKGDEEQLSKRVEELLGPGCLKIQELTAAGQVQGD